MQLYNICVSGRRFVLLWTTGEYAVCRSFLNWPQWPLSNKLILKYNLLQCLVISIMAAHSVKVVRVLMVVVDVLDEIIYFWFVFVFWILCP